jgi:hypothetical protein
VLAAAATLVLPVLFLLSTTARYGTPSPSRRPMAHNAPPAPRPNSPACPAGGLLLKSRPMPLARRNQLLKVPPGWETCREKLLVDGEVSAQLGMEAVEVDVGAGEMVEEEVLSHRGGAVVTVALVRRGREVLSQTGVAVPLQKEGNVLKLSQGLLVMRGVGEDVLSQSGWSVLVASREGTETLSGAGVVALVECQMPVAVEFWGNGGRVVTDEFVCIERGWMYRAEVVFSIAPVVDPNMLPLEDVVIVIRVVVLLTTYTADVFLGVPTAVDVVGKAGVLAGPCGTDKLDDAALARDTAALEALGVTAVGRVPLVRCHGSRVPFVDALLVIVTVVSDTVTVSVDRAML